VSKGLVTFCHKMSATLPVWPVTVGMYVDCMWVAGTGNGSTTPENMVKTLEGIGGRGIQITGTSNAILRRSIPGPPFILP